MASGITLKLYKTLAGVQWHLAFQCDALVH